MLDYALRKAKERAEATGIPVGQPGNPVDIMEVEGGYVCPSCWEETVTVRGDVCPTCDHEKEGANPPC